MKTQHLIIVIVLIFLCSFCNKNEPRPWEQSSPNFLVIMSDNHSARHLGAYGDPTVHTPNIDTIAEQGVLFTHAFAASPSCTPARGALLAGQDIWRLGEGANLWSTLSDTITTYVDLLENSGYQVGHSIKGWGPGNYEAGGRNRNPAGYTFENFNSFLEKHQDDQWHFWIGSRNPHRPFDVGSIENNIDTSTIEVPPYLPNVPEVKEDIAKYYLEIEQFDKQVARAIKLLKDKRLIDNTVVIITSDNGWMMPRGLANLYDFGTRVPLIVSWPGAFKADRKIDDMVNLNDVAPTILEMADMKVPKEFTASSLLPILASDKQGRVTEHRNKVYTARERHALVRDNGLSYPARAIRTYDYLYIHNLKPERWPAGQPPLFGDIDAHELQYESITKEYMMMHKDDPLIRPLYEKAFLKRPEEELYDLNNDPYQLINVADSANYSSVKDSLQQQLHDYLKQTNDPRFTGGGIIWNDQEYYYPQDWVAQPREEAQRKFGLKESYSYRKE